MINPNTLKPFGKFCVTLGMIPSSYKASLTYEEQLLWFCNYLETEVIPAVNNNAEALSEVQALYEEMRQFVVNYFAHLDVQDEIDNKLDEMVEDGTFEEILQEYFDKLDTITATSNFQSNSIKWIAHRGASLEAPENTIPAFQWAHNQFFDCVETDIQASVDNKLYCFHDDTVDRMTNGSGTFSSLYASEIDALTIDAGANVSHYPNLKIPTFEEFLVAIKKLGIIPIIEIKFANDDNLISTFLSTLNEYGMTYNCIVISFNTSILEKIRNLNPKIRLAPILDLSYNNLDYCKNHNFGIDFNFNSSISYQDGLDMIKYAHNNNIFVMAWNYTSMLQQYPLDWNCDYITCDDIMYTNNGDYLNDACYSVINGFKASNKYIANLMQAEDIIPYTSNVGPTNFYERYTPYVSNNLYRTLLFKKIPIRQGTVIYYNCPQGYKFSIVPFDIDDTLIEDLGWFDDTNTSYTCNFEDGAYAVLIFSRTDNTKFSHIDFDNVRNVLLGYDY